MTTSNNDKKVLNVPPLRFPDFKGEWATTTLGSLVDFKNGINADSSKYGSGIKYISVSDVLDQHPILYESIRGSMIASEDQLREFSVTYGDILFQRSSETVEDIGQANVYLDNKPCLFGGFVIRGKKKADYNPLYMKYALKAPINRKKVIIKGAGAQHYNIGQENLFSIPISICGKEEQAKISSLLSDLDLRIDVQRKIIEEKEQLKRWVNNACLWNKDFPKVALNKIIKERNLRTTTVHQYQVLSSAVTGLYSQMDYFKHQISSENDVGYKVVLLNDVVFSPQNLWMGNINFNESFEIGMVSPSYKVYSVNDGFVPFYLSLFLKTARMKYEYSVCSEQGASVVRRNLNEDEFLQIAIPMPDFKTQAAAAKKLKLIVKTIEIEKQCLEALTKEKSFLLSNLFI